MSEVTFRQAEISQNEAESLVHKKGATKGIDPDNVQQTAKINKLVPPLEVYEAVKGRPFLVDYLDVGSIWDLNKHSPQTEKVMGDIPKKIGVIEGWIKTYMERNYIPDNKETVQRTMRMVDKIINYTSETDSLAKLNKVYSFVLSGNKSRAFKNLRKALARRALDQVVDMDFVKATDISEFMPRKEN